MSEDYDGTTERRTASPIGSTAEIPQGTLVTVPSAPPTGSSGSAPVVAVQAVHWYKDPAFLSMVGGGVLALVPVITDTLSQKSVDWRYVALSAVSAIGAYLRNRTNSVLK